MLLRFACSAAVSCITGGSSSNSKDNSEIVLQGNLSTEMETYLSKEWAVPRHLIDTTSAAKKKKK